MRLRAGFAPAFPLTRRPKRESPTERAFLDDRNRTGSYRPVVTREQIVAVTLSWDGVPFHWQGNIRAGCDCLGFIVGVTRELGLPEAESRFARMADYQTVDRAVLREGLEALFDQTDAPQPGDLLLIKIAKKPQHLAIVISDRKMMHCIGTGTKPRVLQAYLPDARHIDSAWTWRGLNEH